MVGFSYVLASLNQAPSPAPPATFHSPHPCAITICSPCQARAQYSIHPPAVAGALAPALIVLGPMGRAAAPLAARLTPRFVAQTFLPALADSAHHRGSFYERFHRFLLAFYARATALRGQPAAQRRFLREMLARAAGGGPDVAEAKGNEGGEADTEVGRAELLFASCVYMLLLGDELTRQGKLARHFFLPRGGGQGNRGAPGQMCSIADSHSLLLNSFPARLSIQLGNSAVVRAATLRALLQASALSDSTRLFPRTFGLIERECMVGAQVKGTENRARDNKTRITAHLCVPRLVHDCLRGAGNLGSKVRYVPEAC